MKTKHYPAFFTKPTLFQGMIQATPDEELNKDNYFYSSGLVRSFGDL